MTHDEYNSLIRPVEYKYYRFSDSMKKEFPEQWEFLKEEYRKINQDAYEDGLLKIQMEDLIEEYAKHYKSDVEKSELRVYFGVYYRPTAFYAIYLSPEKTVDDLERMCRTGKLENQICGAETQNKKLYIRVCGIVGMQDAFRVEQPLDFDMSLSDGSKIKDHLVLADSFSPPIKDKTPRFVGDPMKLILNLDLNHKGNSFVVSSVVGKCAKKFAEREKGVKVDVKPQNPNLGGKVKQ